MGMVSGWGLKAHGQEGDLYLGMGGKQKMWN